MKSLISGKDAAYVARESLKRRPIKLLPPEGVEDTSAAPVPSDAAEQARKAPPRVLKPSALNDQCVAPTPDLESHRKRLREAFGNTMSDEFVEVLLGKLVEALRPGSLEALEEPTVNAALAIIDSMCPQSELEALLVVQIIAAGFSGLRLLRQSQQQMTQDYIDVYGNYAIKLLRLQNEMIQTFDRYRRGNKQTVEVRHVHTYIPEVREWSGSSIHPAIERGATHPELVKLLTRLDLGDVLILKHLDRLARSTRDLLNLRMCWRRQARAGFRSVKDTWADTTKE